jgi:Bifunctional DNA primase/polymerase, N-terminal/Primase C terminal 1 (PriCT-1)
MTTATASSAGIPDGLEVVIDLGFGVFPCRADYVNDDCKEKAPLTEHGKNDATQDREEIAHWANKFRGCAWGARPPENITVLDIDVKNGTDGFATLAALEQKHGALPRTLSNNTASRGQHRVFKTDGTVYKNQAGVQPGLDVRSNGGYIIVPPSAIRPKGCKKPLPYGWEDVSQAVADAPDWLVREIFSADTSGGKRKKNDHSKQLPEGKRNDGLFRYACALREQDIPEDHAWDLLQARNAECVSPPGPLGLAELRQALASAWRYPPGDALAGIDSDVIALIKSERPTTIILPNANLQISYAADRIFRQMGAGREMFLRSNTIVELLEDGSLERVSKDAMCSRLEGSNRRRVLHVVKINRGQDRPVERVLVQAQCSPNTAGLLMASPQIGLLPPLAMISECALLVEHEGELRMLGKGYHPIAGGVLVRGDSRPPDVPLTEAVPALLALFDQFRFTGPSDKSRAMAHLIGPALRFGGLLKGFALMSAVEAKESQTGKGFMVKLVRVPYRASAYEVVQRTGGVGSLDETLAEAILAGYPFIAFENVRGRLDSPLLEQGLTTHEKYAVRVPHKASVRIDLSRTMFQLTSNGAEGTIDLANRMLLARLENYQGVFTTFPEGDLLAHVEAKPDYYLGCIFAVVRAWHAAGKIELPTQHKFRHWVGALDYIVQKIMGLPPLLDGHAAAIQRIANPGLSWLRLIAGEVTRRQLLGKELSASQLLELSHDIGVPVCDSDDEKKQLLAVGRRMAAAFARSQDDAVAVDGMVVTRVQTVDRQGNTRKRYTFGGEEVDM